MTIRIIKFTVEGRGTFPLDMLRYDCCWPVSSEDAANIDSDYNRERRVVNLKMVSWQGAQGQPTVERWRSFLWGVDLDSIQVEL
ncbi:hypothetical protein CMI47_12410 [Candidatus Pacearchaeota archaeon]|jgi:hypothetical protein|nr:hypothetical protein [Candidatus Pacearchaeota archaeon]|tara:strand:- start:260 stop:511 length:252 start_codon:yes stop_codon:yes gene_type:complete